MPTDMKISITVLFISLTLSFISAGKILAVYPTPSFSHQIVFRTLTQELVRRGHEVTVITTDPAFPKGQAPPNLIEIDVHELSYEMWSVVLTEEKAQSEFDHHSQIVSLLKLMSKIFEAQLATKEVQEIINMKNTHYDLLLLEAYMKPALIFTHIFKAPTIQISSLGALLYIFEAVGAPTHPLLYPPITSQRLYNLSHFDKLQQLYYRWWMERSYSIIEEEDDKVLQKLFGPNTPSIRELFYNVDMLFMNVHPIWMSNLPVPPNVIHIGGIHTHPPMDLPKELDSLLNASKNGVIYFSLGTNVNTTNIPPNKIKMMIEVFSKLPYDVIWKWDQDSMPGKTDNIKLFKWVPQPDLLKHPKIKLFITQGGLQSTDEAIDAGVPVIGIPMLGDQWYNTEKYQHHNIGIKLDLSELTGEVFRKAIEDVLTDKSYRENIIRMRTFMKDEPQAPLERAVWWTEYVLRHGGAKHLRAAGANVSWAQYLELELVTIVALLWISGLVIIYLIVKYIRFLVKIDYSQLKIKNS